jgi:hypothetical protein
MSAPILTLPGAPVPILVKKKRVLLLDASRPKRDLRSETMRKLGMEVDCAADVSEARCWWRAGLYDLVLINVQEGSARDKFCDDMRRAVPVQQIMFFVGKPEYLATEPNGPSPVPQEDAQIESSAQVKFSPAGGTPDRVGGWGILEACRRISAVRNVSDARARAIRNRPLPPRDSEVPQSKRATEPDLFDQVFPENAQ